MSSIPNSVMPHATSNEPARSSSGRGAVSRMIRLATLPALVCLGAGVLAYEQMRQFHRGWLKAEG